MRMTILVQSKTMPVTQALREFVDRQAEKLLKLERRVSTIAVYLEKIAGKNNDPRATTVKYLVRLKGKKELVVCRHATDMYEAIAEATRRVASRLKQYKQQRIESHRMAALDELEALRFI
jgi:ribosomal subunit interface protein